MAFRRKYCTFDECLPLVTRIKQSLSSTDIYEPVEMYFNLNKAGNFTVKAKYKINDEIRVSVAYVNRFGNVIYFENVEG